MEEKYYFFQSNNRKKTIKSFLDPLEENCSEEDSLRNGLFYSGSNTSDIDSDSIISIQKEIDELNFAISSDINNGSLDKKDKKEETFSINLNNDLTFSIGVENIFMHFPYLLNNANFSKKNLKQTKKTLGRKKKGEASSQQEEPSHGIYSEDNIFIKIQTHYLNFIIAFLNCLFPHLKYKKKLYKLDQKFKINILKNNIESLNDKTIGEIISNKISEKYRSINDKTNANKIICEEIKKNPILNNILSENYLIFFKKFYYNSDSYINLKDYGLDEDIIFTKGVKNFKHLLKDNEIRGAKYIMSIKECALRNYLPDLMFIC